MKRTIANAGLSLLLACCAKPTVGQVPTASSAQAPSAEPARGKGLGEVMTTVGRRFELLGRAMEANRWELAEYEAGELGELFESDVPRAMVPNEGPTAHIPAMTKAFLETYPPLLQKAAAAKDSRAFKETFSKAATACNACHAASNKAFLEIPDAPGRLVPNMDPVAEPEGDAGPTRPR